MEIDWMLDTNPVLLALYATLFTWTVTALGAAMVFYFKTINKKVLNSMLGFAAGVAFGALAHNPGHILKLRERVLEFNTIPWLRQKTK